MHGKQLAYKYGSYRLPLTIIMEIPIITKARVAVFHFPTRCGSVPNVVVLMRYPKLSGRNVNADCHFCAISKKHFSQMGASEGEDIWVD